MRRFNRYRALVVVTVCLISSSSAQVSDSATIRLNGTLELFDSYDHIAQTSGDVAIRLQFPNPEEVVLTADEPWEGNASAYFTVFRDGDLFRMYYRGWHYVEATGTYSHPEVTCYAESIDGVHWTKPNLGLFQMNGSKSNNIVWAGVASSDFTVFKDENPQCSVEEKYKAVGIGSYNGSSALYAFISSDGIRWKPLQASPIVEKGTFDSQNVAFWDPNVRRYREYHRGSNGVRSIMTSDSFDFIHWTDPLFLKYSDSLAQEMYTNAIMPYARAPQILVGFPTRFLPTTHQTEPLFMTSRDGSTFTRWNDAVIPLTAPTDRSGDRSNYAAWGVLQLPGKPAELSIYATEAYYTGNGTRLRRFTYRLDGFTSLHASAYGGQVITKPLKMVTANLAVNYRAATTGSLSIEILDDNGNTICSSGELRGDELNYSVQWQHPSINSLDNQTVRIKFNLRDCDLYSYRFNTSSVSTAIARKTYDTNTFKLFENYPNPFNGNTMIEFSLPASSFVTLKVFNVLGEQVSTLFSREYDAGTHVTNLEPKAIASGLYFYRLEAIPLHGLGKRYVATKKMIYCK